MKFDSFKTLILDDSPVAINMTRSILSKIGIREDLILFSQSPKAGVSIARREQFDIVICDYNFNTTLSGRQVMEEMEHYNCLSSSSVFILVTGDSSVQTVNSMLELSIDDYILKPFNLKFLKKRLINVIKRKHALQEIYEHKKKGDFQQGLELCDQLLPFYPNYSHHIFYEKGVFLRRLRLWEESFDYYSTLAIDDSSHWIQLGLSNSLYNLGKVDEAKTILDNVLSDKPFSVEALKQMSVLDTATGKIPDSIKNLELLRSLTKGSSERELALSNLCLAVEDYEYSYKYFKNYFSMIKDTFRNGVWTKVNMLRRSLLDSDANIKDQSINIEIEPLLNELAEGVSECENLNFAISSASAHFLLLNHKYDESITLMNRCFRDLKSLDNLHFYDIYYFCQLLLKFSFDSEFLSLASRLKDEYDKQLSMHLYSDSFEVVIASMDVMLKNIHTLHNEKSKWLLERHAQVNELKGVKKLNLLIDISNQYPTLVSVRLEILTLLSEVWPDDYGRVQVKKLITSSDEIIRCLSDDNKLKKLDYENVFYNASKTVENNRVKA